MTFDRFEIGQVFETGARRLDTDEITDFARRYDWQYFHTDAEAAKASPFGGLIASGFQTLLTAFTLTLEAGIWEGTGMGSPGMDALRWLAPVRPGDTLSVRIEVIAKRPSASKPDRGLVTFANTVVNQDGTTVMTYDTMVIVARDAAAARPAG